jgi:hypothetical protein
MICEVQLELRHAVGCRLNHVKPGRATGGTYATFGVVRPPLDNESTESSKGHGLGSRGGGEYDWAAAAVGTDRPSFSSHIQPLSPEPNYTLELACPKPDETGGWVPGAHLLTTVASEGNRCAELGSEAGTMQQVAQSEGAAEGGSFSDMLSRLNQTYS